MSWLKGLFNDTFEFSDLLTVIAMFVAMISAIISWVKSYKAKISEQQSEQYKKANLSIVTQDLKLNGYSMIEFVNIVYSKNSINFYYKDNGKFPTSSVQFINLDIEVDDSQRIIFKLSDKFNTCYRKDGSDKHGNEVLDYFSCNLSVEDMNISNHIENIPANLIKSDNISAEKNMVLWMEYELHNVLGVVTKCKGKLIAQKTSPNSFCINGSFISMADISTLIDEIN